MTDDDPGVLFKGPSDPGPATDATRRAVELLTLWLEPDRPAAIARIREALVELPDEDRMDITVQGLLNLGLMLLMHEARQHGGDDPSADELRQIARTTLAHISVQLPEAP